MKSFYYNYKEEAIEEFIINNNITKSVVYTKNIDIFTLISQGNLTATRKAIEKGDITLYHRNDKGQTLLHWAILYNQIEIAKELLALGASLDLADNNGKTIRDIIKYCSQNTQDSFAVFLLSKVSAEESYVENEQHENQDVASVLGSIHHND
jgi:ankyrin repeat protein